MANMFDEFTGQNPEPEAPPPARTPEGRTAITVTAPLGPKTQAGPGMFDEFTGSPTSNIPKPPPPPDPYAGEIRNPDPVSTTEWFRQKGQDALIALGMQPYDAGHFAKGATGIAKLNPYVSFAFGAGDLRHHLPRGEWAESFGDVLSMVPGTIAGARRIQGQPQIQMEPNPSRREMVQAPRDNYNAAANSPVELHPYGANALLDRSKQLLEQPGASGGFNELLAPTTYGTINSFQRMWSERGTPVTGQDMEGLRQQLMNVSGGKDGEAARRVRDYLDAYRSYPPQGHVVSGTGQDVADLRRNISDARGNYRSRKTAESVDAAVYNSELQGSSANSGANTGNNTRQAIKSLVRIDPKTGERTLWGARPDEVAALEGVVHGDPTTNYMRKWSARLGGGGGIGQTGVAALGGHTLRAGLGATAAGGAAHFGGLDPVTSGGIALVGASTPVVAGQALRAGANARTALAAEDAINLIRRNSPYYQSRAAINPPIDNPNVRARDAITNALLPPASDEMVRFFQKLRVPYKYR